MKKLFFLLFIAWQAWALQAQTNDGPKIGGRFFLDFSTFVADNDLQDLFPEQAAVGGAEFRVLSLHFKGAATENMDYKVQVALHGSRVRLQDVYLRIKDLPGLGGNLWVGHIAEPLTLSSAVSANYTVFMERNPVSGYMPRRNTGLMYEREAFEHRLGLQVGAFFDADAASANAMLVEQNLHYNARLTGLLVSNKPQSKYLLLGAAYSLRHPTAGEYTYRPTQSNHLEPRFLSYQVTNAQYVSLPAIQFVLISGPLSLQGEYVRGNIRTETNIDFEIPSYYAFVSYFLTGEHRNYKSSYGGFGRVKVNKAFSPANKQWGAWEIAARMGYSHIQSLGLQRSYLREYTLGLNWYLNNHTRMMFNYVLSDVNGQGREHAGMMRMQVNF